MKTQQLLTSVIQPTLNFLGFDGLAAQNLILGTAAQESHMGQYLTQVNGPALGIYQIEPATHDDLFNNFLAYHVSIKDKVMALACSSYASSNLSDQLVGNLYYATAIIRLIYWRTPAILPDANDIQGLANYWKQYYNTPLGAGTTDEFIANYNTYVVNG